MSSIPPRRGLLAGTAWMPYALLLPGLLWLGLFFVTPILTLLSTSLQEGSISTGFRLTWRFANYTNAFWDYREQFGRSIVYAGLATLLALVICYPLAYFIAFRAGRYKNLMLLIVVAPFFTSFLIRTLSWKIILADSGWIVRMFQTFGLRRQAGACWQLLLPSWPASPTTSCRS